MLCSYVYEGMYLHFVKKQRDIYSAFDVSTSVHLLWPSLIISYCCDKKSKRMHTLLSVYWILKKGSKILKWKWTGRNFEATIWLMISYHRLLKAKVTHNWSEDCASQNESLQSHFLPPDHHCSNDGGHSSCEFVHLKQMHTFSTKLSRPCILEVTHFL